MLRGEGGWAEEGKDWDRRETIEKNEIMLGMNGVQDANSWPK